MFHNITGDELAAHAYAVEDVLQGGMIGGMLSGISQTAGDMFVFLYTNTYTCSSVTLKTLQNFLSFKAPSQQHNFKEEDEAQCGIDVASFRT